MSKRPYRRLLAESHPELAAELLVPGDRERLVTSSRESVSWRCENGHEWVAKVANRVYLSRGCPVCAGQRPVLGVNDLGTTHPAYAAELVDRDSASRLMAGTNRSVAWRCAAGHEWRASPANRIRHEQGCPYCSGRLALPGETDLATTHPALAAELVDRELGSRLRAGSSGHAVEWRCAAGHVWSASPATRVGGHGCPYCSGRLAIVGETDLGTVSPELAAQLVDQSLGSVLTARSGRKVRWRCEAGHEWNATVTHRANGRGCPTCAKTGFDVNAPAWVYLLGRPSERNVGITGDVRTRLARHAQDGWPTVLDVAGPFRGSEALAWETDVKRWLRRNVGTLPGTTECWAIANGADVRTLSALAATTERALPAVVPDRRANA